MKLLSLLWVSYLASSPKAALIANFHYESWPAVWQGQLWAGRSPNDKANSSFLFAPEFSGEEARKVKSQFKDDMMEGDTSILYCQYNILTVCKILPGRAPSPAAESDTTEACSISLSRSPEASSNTAEGSGNLSICVASLCEDQFPTFLDRKC